MYVYGMDEKTLGEIAQTVGVNLHHIRKEGRALRFTLLPASAKFRPRDKKGRKMNKVCFHGYTKFYEAVFRVQPEARIRTAVEDYKGVADFKARNAQVALVLRGPDEREYAKTCDCHRARPLL